MNFIYYILFTLPVCYSSSLVSTLMEKIDYDKDYDISFYYDLSKHIASFSYLSDIGTYTSSEFSFDRECVSVVKTNTLLEVDCQLPARCGHVNHYKYSQSWIGQEVLICYSFHPTSSSTYSTFYNIKFNKISDFSYPINSYSTDVVRISNILPIDFFSHFVVRNVSTGFSIMPQICLEHFTSLKEDKPVSVQFREEGKSICVDHSVIDNSVCTPLYFSSLSQLIAYFDFPIGYTGNPYVLASHQRYKNQDPLVTSYASSSSTYYPVSFIDNTYFVSHVPPLTIHNYLHNSKNYIYHSDNQKDIKKQSFCNPIISLYKNPVSELANSILSVVSPIFYKFLELLETNLERLFKLMVKALLIIILSLVDLLNKLITPNIISSIVCSFAVYLYFKDYLITFLSFLAFLFIFMYLLV